MNAFRHPADGDTRPCPQCRNTLVLSSRYPVLTEGDIAERAFDRRRLDAPAPPSEGGAEVDAVCNDNAARASFLSPSP
jgi:hypothetical protein